MKREELEKLIVKRVKTTVGYYESDNQVEFLKGAKIAAKKASEILIEELKQDV